MPTPKPTPLYWRLIEEACGALRDAGFVDPDDDCMPTFVERPYPEARIDVWKKSESAARAVLEPVLRLLASTGHMSPRTLTSLADRINPGGPGIARKQTGR